MQFESYLEPLLSKLNSLSDYTLLRLVEDLVGRIANMNELANEFVFPDKMVHWAISKQELDHFHHHMIPYFNVLPLCCSLWKPHQTLSADYRVFVGSVFILQPRVVHHRSSTMISMPLSHYRAIYDMIAQGSQ